MLDEVCCHKFSILARFEHCRAPRTSHTAGTIPVCPLYPILKHGFPTLDKKSNILTYWSVQVRGNNRSEIVAICSRKEDKRSDAHSGNTGQSFKYLIIVFTKTK